MPEEPSVWLHHALLPALDNCAVQAKPFMSPLYCCLAGRLVYVHGKGAQADDLADHPQQSAAVPERGATPDSSKQQADVNAVEESPKQPSYGVLDPLMRHADRAPEHLPQQGDSSPHGQLQHIDGLLEVQPQQVVSAPKPPAQAGHGAAAGALIASSSP